MRVDFYLMPTPSLVNDNGIVQPESTGLQLIKQWHDIKSARDAIPLENDWVILHWGEYNERGEVYRVFKRIIDGLQPDVLKCVVVQLNGVNPEVYQALIGGGSNCFSYQL